jgi:hypothetical protein
LNFFFSDVPVHVPEHIGKQLEAPFGKIWGQNISLKNPNPNPKKIICGSESESEKNEFGSTTLLSILVIVLERSRTESRDSDMRPLHQEGTVDSQVKRITPFSGPVIATFLVFVIVLVIFLFHCQ